MKRSEHGGNPDLVEPAEKRFKSNQHQQPTGPVQPLATQQPPAAPTQTPQTVTQPQLVPPVKPVSTRRVLTANLDDELNPQVAKLVNERADVMVTNYKLVRTAEPAIRLAELPVPAKEANRSTAVQVYENLERVRAERVKDTQLLGAVRASSDVLIIRGKGQSVAQTFKEITTDDNQRTLVEALGMRRGMVSTIPGEVRAINPGFKVGSQALQLLGHLSQAFLNKVNDMEYQAMLVNDRVFVAANEQTAIASFAGMHLRDLLAEGTRNIILDTDPKAKVRAYKIGALCEALKLDKASTAQLTRVQEDGAKMLAEYALGYHIDHTARKPLRSLLNILRHQAVNGPAMLGPFTPDVARDYVADPKYKNKVILVKTPVLKGWHAEQALVYTMILANWTAGAFVAGSKLPCFGCWLTLNLLPQRGYPLSFTKKPGYIWGTTMSGLTAVAKRLGVASTAEVKLLCQNAYGYTEDRFLQYMTAIEPLDDLTVVVVKGQMGESVSGLTQAMSQGSFYLAQKAPVTTSIAGTPYPDEPPGSPFGYYESPPNSPGRVHDEAELADYDGKVKEFTSAQEKAAAAINNDAGGTTTK